jgi:hypothetical protein
MERATEELWLDHQQEQWILLLSNIPIHFWGPPNPIFNERSEVILRE